MPDDGRNDLEPRGPSVATALRRDATLPGGRSVYVPLAVVGDIEVIQSVTGGLVLRWPDGRQERCGMASLDRVIAELTAKLK